VVRALEQLDLRSAPGWPGRKPIGLRVAGIDVGRKATLVRGVRRRLRSLGARSIREVQVRAWYDAVEFCDRLTAHTGRQYRLPSEAEWEYACRAGTTTPFHFGSTITTEIANYRGIDDESLGMAGAYGDASSGEYRQETTAVDHFGTANAFGLCDMHGNVWEWCADYWHETYANAPSDGSAWLQGGVSSLRILRGGSWNSIPRNCRSAYRNGYLPDFIDFTFGFRVVCSGLSSLS
jgi:formylglycine-generating enzyme required for sulfatase activity